MCPNPRTTFPPTWYEGRREPKYCATATPHTFLECLSLILIWYVTPWSGVLPQKLTGLQLVNEFPTFYGNLRFITAFTSARHQYLSWASWILASTSSFLKIHFNIILPSTPRSSKWYISIEIIWISNKLSFCTLSSNHSRRVLVFISRNTFVFNPLKYHPLLRQKSCCFCL